MRLCIPTADDRGLRGRASPHFGSAPFFTLVDDATRDVQVVVNPTAAHRHGRCTPVEELRRRGVEAVVCRGLGARALGHLRTMGIPVLRTDRWEVAEIVAAFSDGG